MDWQAATEAEIHGQIDRLRDDETAQAVLEAMADDAERRSLAAAATAHDLGERARAAIAFDRAERERLEAELGQPIPGQRPS